MTHTEMPRLAGTARSTDQPPGNHTEQRADEGRDQILEGDFDFAKTKVDAEQPEQASADDCTEHAETKVGPESEALFGKGH